MNYLGVDYGTAHVGIALSTGSLVEPLATVTTETAANRIARFVEEHKVDTIIIGLPEGPIKAEVEKFIHTLRNLNFKVIPFDETLSSVDARDSLLHTTQSRRKAKEHSVSAALILASYLDSLQEKEI
jgi:putative transcription antitermination factor YqgF